MELGILGPLRALTDDGTEIDLGGPRRRALLAVLLVDVNRAVPAEALVERLWDGDPPPGAAGTLQSHVSHLRRALGRDRIETQGSAYRVRVEPGEVDAAAFESDLSEGKAFLAAGQPLQAADALARGLARWRGPALADAAGASWAVVEARRLDELRLVATESLLEAHLGSGRHAEVVAAAEAAIGEHPLRERLWAHLLLALYRDGRQADALRAYQRLRALLAQELGIDPSPELRTLEAAILAQDAAIAPPADIPEPAARSEQPTLPSGVVTFLLTDVVASTRLWESAPQAMAQALIRHDALMRGAVETHGGTLLKARGEGDSTFSVFRRATDAVAAARAAAMALAAEPWPADAPITVRAAIHTGEVHERDGDYYGRAVNRAARLRAVAEADQVLLSRTTADLVIDHLPDDSHLLELGTHQLADLARSETVFALVIDGGGRPAPAQAEREKVVFPARLASAQALRFVGRAAETELLERRRKEAFAGDPRVVLVAGEPGIGKTSLSANAAMRAHAEGAIVVYGRCDADLGVPYLPWVEAVEQLLASTSPERLRAVDARALGDLARLVPSIVDRLPGVSAAAPGDPEGDRYRLFAAVTTVLAAAVEAEPVVVVLDDLHWADKPTLVLLRHLVTSASGRLLLLGTYRPSDLTPDHFLTDLLAALRREARVDRIALGGLGDDDVVRLVEALSGQAITGPELGLVHAVQRETDGNPFFTLELLLHLLEVGIVSRSESGQWSVVGDPADVGLPESVREVVARRVAHLGELGQRVLETAAVIGRSFQLDVLEAVTDPGGEDVLTVLERAEAAALVTSVAPGEFGFTHALITHALYEGLGTTRRARLHGRVAEALEELGHGERRVNELARHWAAAARPLEVGKAIDYAAAAGRQALSALAPDEAVRWFSQAVELAEHLPGTEERVRCELLVWLGRAQRQAAIPEFRETLLTAAWLAERVGDAGLLARAALANNRGLFSGAGEIDAERVSVLQAALDRLPDEDSALRARLLATLAAELTFDPDEPRRRRLTDEALAMARRIGDAGVLVNVLALRFSAIWTTDMLDERRANMAEAQEAAAATGSATAVAWVDTLAHIAAVEAGDTAEADRSLERVVDNAEQLGMPFLRATAHYCRSSRALRVGDLEEATRSAEAAREIGLSLGRQEWGTVTGPIFEVYWYQGRLREMSEILEIEAVETRDTEHVVRAVWIACQDGDSATAGRLLDEAMAAGLVERNDQWLWLFRMAIWAEVAVRIDARHHAAAIYAALRPYHDRLTTTGSSLNTVVAHSLGLLAELLGDGNAADDHFREAIAVTERIGSVFHLARAQAAWGAILIGRPSEDEVQYGEDLLRTAWATATQFGCDGVAREAETALASRPTPLPPQLRPDKVFPFAGRTAERGVLDAAWSDARDGRCRLVLVSGEPGIGKTRLLQETAAVVHTGGGAVAYGRCEEDLAAPYQPFVEALDHLAVHATDDAIEAHLARCGDDLARVVRALARRTAQVPERLPSDPETERWRLFEAFGDLLHELASRAPVLLVLDDLQWADPSTLLLLRHLVVSRGSAPLLVVATYRDTAGDMTEPLADALAALWRAPGVERVELTGLDERELLDLMHELAGHGLGAGGEALARTISHRTGGNPFFATELLRHVEETGAAVAGPSGRWALRDEPGTLPESVRDVVLQRVRRLGDTAEHLLTLAALTGREFDLAIVAGVGACTEDDVLDAVESAAAAGIVVEVSDRPDRFAFSHALVIEALTSALTAARRRRVHRRIAEALEAAGSPLAAEVAHHWIEAGDAANGCLWAVRAGDEAAAAIALHDAARWYATALGLAEQAEADAPWRCDVLLRLGRAQRDAGQPEFRDTLLSATRLARSVGDDRRQIRAALANGRGFLTFSTDVERQEALREALAVAGIDDSAHRARLLATLALEVRYAGLSESRALTDEALAIARRLADPATLLWVLNMRYTAVIAPETLELRLRDTAEAVALAVELGDPSAEYWALSWRHQVLLEAADLDGADLCTERVDALLDELRRPLQWHDLMQRANRARLAGHLDLAESLGAEGRRLAEATGQPDAAVLTGPDLAHEALLRGRLGELVAELETNITRAQAADELRPSLAHALAAAGRKDEALALLEDIAASGYSTAAGVYGAYPLSHLVMWACTAVRLDARDYAAPIFDRLLPWKGRAAAGGPSVFGMVDHHLGALARVLGRHDLALELLAEAEAAEERMPAPYWLAATRLEQARVLHAQGDDAHRPRIAGLLHRVHAVARERGFGELEREATTLANLATG